MWRVVEEIKQSRSKRKDEIIVANGGMFGPIVVNSLAIKSRIFIWWAGIIRNAVNKHDAICGIVGLKVTAENPLLIVSGRIRNLLTEWKIRSKLHTELSDTALCGASRIILIGDPTSVCVVVPR